MIDLETKSTDKMLNPSDEVSSSEIKKSGEFLKIVENKYKKIQCLIVNFIGKARAHYV